MNLQRTNIVNAALAYAERGIPVGPLYGIIHGRCSCDNPSCTSPGKHPIQKHGFKDFTTDPELIHFLWQKNPNANIGGRMGSESGLVAIDLDVKPDESINGLESWRDLQAAFDLLPDGPVQLTGGGGAHHLFMHPGQEFRSSTNALGKHGFSGIDIRADRSYIVLAPSVHLSGRKYEWEATCELLDIDPPLIPDWLLQLLGKVQRFSDSEATFRTCALPLGRRAKEFLDGTVPRGEQRLRAVAAARNLQGTGKTELETFELVWEGLQRSNQDPLRPWTKHDAATIVESVFASHAPIHPNGRQRNAKSDTPISSALPQIVVGGRQVREITRDALNALSEENSDDPQTFVHSGQLSSVRRGSIGSLMISPISEIELRYKLNRAVDWVNPSGLASKQPKEIAQEILCVGNWPELPLLDGISMVPYLPPKGRVIHGPGYSKETLRILNLEGLEVIKPHSTNAALDLLTAKLLGDFPFVSTADLAHALALAVEPFLRTALGPQGFTPMYAIKAPRRGSGKSLLAKCCAIVALGHEPAPHSTPQKEDEWAKLIGSLLASGSPYAYFDNISHPVDSASLAMALTSPMYSFRGLCTNKMIVAPNRATWVATMNEGSLSTEIARRSVGIRIDPQRDDPENRRGLKDLPTWTFKCRGELVGAIVDLLNAWEDANRPRYSGLPMASFELWSSHIGGFLEYFGIDGFLQNREALNDALNPIDGCLRMFFRRAYEVHGSNIVSAAKLIEIVNEDESFESALLPHGRQTNKSAITLGNQLQAMVKNGSVFAGIRITQARKIGNTNQYRFEPVDPTYGTKGTQSESISKSLGRNSRDEEKRIETSLGPPQSPQSPNHPLFDHSGRTIDEPSEGGPP